MFKFRRMDSAVAVACMFDKETSIQEVEKLQAKGLSLDEIINTIRARHIFRFYPHVALDEVDSKFTPYEREVCEYRFAICKYCGAAEDDWATNSTCYKHLQSEGALS